MNHELANRVDPSTRSELGTLGERFVAEAARSQLRELGRTDLAVKVRHVSLISDQLGYDVVTPRVSGDVLRLEVKTTRRATSQQTRVFISRNEAKVALRDSAWRLVVCRDSGEGQFDFVGWCRGSALSALLPKDAPRGRWESAVLTLGAGCLEKGFPRLDENGSVASSDY
jgi:hypothetical protein